MPSPEREFPGVVGPGPSPRGPRSTEGTDTRQLSTGCDSSTEALATNLDQLIDDLVAGRVPFEKLRRVREYEHTGATLVRPPDAIWSHQRADAVAVATGGWHIVLPLWTTEESPSDLSAKVRVDADGTAELLDVHVL